MNSLNWKDIIPIKGTQNGGFEEFCTQLAYFERPTGSKFFRKGTPDAGVECYCILGDGNEWGWQAKYVGKFSDSLWGEIDKSVKTALEKHPRLVRYIICVPLDRSDVRKDRVWSAMERWNARVTNWEKWALQKGMAVEFVFWGSHELINLLVGHPHQVGLFLFFFGNRVFDNDWFSARADESISTVGPRYTPELNIDLPIAATFDAFGRTELFFDQIKSKARDIRKKQVSIRLPESEAVDPVHEASIFELESQVLDVLKMLGELNPQPIGELPLHQIADKIATAEDTVGRLNEWLLSHEREFNAKFRESAEDAGSAHYKPNPYREHRSNLISLSTELRYTKDELIHAIDIAGNTILLLTGDAGTGKTHLLCDVARQRIKANRPTVLLMGQRFKSTEDPWTQALHQLDLSDLTAEKFTGILECAAQAAGCRALVIIDALNEGEGRIIWPDNLSAFLAHLERSPWIGVVLSVRSSFEELIIPENLRSRAAYVKHNGFADHEYNATRSFFEHYGLELPSTPLLESEFSNPLFLVHLCKGLKAMDMHRLPRGIQGISTVFNLHIKGINNRLAEKLGFNPNKDLIREALEAFAKELVDLGERWLPLARAEDVINALLSGREFERSLYHGLVIEGLLIEEFELRSQTEREVVVYIAYERFADHLIASVLLDIHLTNNTLGSAFSFGKTSAIQFIEGLEISPGLLEALCIQVPERTGQELISVSPKIADCWGIGDAFRQSLIWRNTDAFSGDTEVILKNLIRSPHDWDDTFGTLLTVAVLCDHPYNAIFLDQHLRGYTMPDRDMLWSTYLHRTWNTHSIVDRLIDWGSSVTPDMTLEAETIDLCAIALSWMLTTSNRTLRDLATKALVSLLTGRLSAVTRLIKRFADVNDPYVAERIYAAAYGTAMRSQDPVEICILAQTVYDQIFANGIPPAHILLRDYARGVVERAVYLGATINIVIANIRPPYSSQWPNIPTEEDIQPLLPDWSHGSHDSGDLAWSYNIIGSSVMDSDFANYVIGINHSNHSQHWLALRLDEPAWQSPNKRLMALLDEFSESEERAWLAFKEIDDRVKYLSSLNYLIAEINDDEAIQDVHYDYCEGKGLEDVDELKQELIGKEKERDARFTALESVLTEEHAQRLKELLTAIDDADKQDPPGFDLRLLQRYILWRVFDLGWTSERFAKFDRFGVRNFNGDLTKSERIGKKYQWIAYHEILALVADHFQFKEDFQTDPDNYIYQGPWQYYLREIDPSSTLKASKGRTSFHGHSPSWWCPTPYENWGDHLSTTDWISRSDDLPELKDLLITDNPEDGSRWINVQGYISWVQGSPSDKEPTAVDRREIWYIFVAYFIRIENINDFFEWAKGVDFMGRWMPEPPSVHGVFIGEHGWSPAFQHFQKQYYHDIGSNGWTRPHQECPVDVRVIGVEYRSKMGDRDFSTNDSFPLRLPSNELIAKLNLQWSGNAADYLDTVGRLAVFDPAIDKEGPNALLFREDLLKDYLTRENLTICWIVLGEKQVLHGRRDIRNPPRLGITGAFYLDKDKLKGSNIAEVHGESSTIESKS